MKFVSETSALKRLRTIKDDLRSSVSIYENQAKPCASCATPGACCLDQHFVNVRISRLEAVAIARVVKQLPIVRRVAAEERMARAAEDLLGTEASFACPLYESGAGCLVHDEAKPVPCVVHACYERHEDLPPDELQDAAEESIDRLNTRVYGSSMLKPLPTAVHEMIVQAKNGHV